MDVINVSQQMESKMPADVDVKALESALGEVFGSLCEDMSDIAIPSFGSFKTSKLEESIFEDASTGKRYLLPPSISVKFNMSVVLKKRFS